MRPLVLLALLTASVNAFASYDLMLLGDNTTAGASKIVRYDPVSGASFGSFGQGYFTGNILSITADVTTGRCYVQSSGSTYTFNYSTGEFLGSFIISNSFGDIHYDVTTGSLTTGNGQGSGTDPGRRYNVTTGANITTYSGGYISTAPNERSGSTRVFSYGLTGGLNIGLFSHVSSTGAVSATIDTGLPWTGPITPRQAVFVGTKLLGVFGDGSTYSRFYSMDTTATGFTGALSTTNFGSSFTGTTNIANGHGNLIYLRCGNQLTLMDPLQGVTYGTRTLPIASATAVQGMAVILAPEPSTWFGMAVGSLGLLAVLRRKRRS